MKINEVERQLGITKANIRFYEKEGLLSPIRRDNGYREYSEAHILQLKQIIILRKLGIPVQQIADILDGALPLQDAVNSNIQSLQAEIEKLNGALLLCRQLKQEQAWVLDTERYWVLIQQQEEKGFRFKSLMEDYLKFSEINYQWLFWPLPVEDLRSPWKVCLFILAASLLGSFGIMLGSDLSFLSAFVHEMLLFLQGILLWTAIFVPLYILSRKRPKLANRIMTVMLILVPIAMTAAVILVMTIGYYS